MEKQHILNLWIIISNHLIFRIMTVAVVHLFCNEGLLKFTAHLFVTPFHNWFWMHVFTESCCSEEDGFKCSLISCQNYIHVEGYWGWKHLFFRSNLHNTAVLVAIKQFKLFHKSHFFICYLHIYWTNISIIWL